MSRVEAVERRTSIQGAHANEEHRHEDSFRHAPHARLADATASRPLKRGHEGPAVLELKERLNAAGMRPPLDTSHSRFDARTESAVYLFQTINCEKVDGKVGPETFESLRDGGSFDRVPRSRLRSDATSVPTQQQIQSRPAGSFRAGQLAFSSPAALYGAGRDAPGRASGPMSTDRQGREAQAARWLAANGVPLEEGKTYVIQVDQDPPPASASSQERLGYLRSYTGQTSVFRVVNGRLEEQDGPFTSAAHPGQKTTSGFTDVNADGRDDIAHLRSGVYEYSARSYGGRFNPTNDRQMSVARDLNQDGTIDANEDARAAQLDYYATGLQWHAGNESRPSSVGCQTMPPDQFDRFSRAVKEGEGRSFTYLLLRRPNDRFGENPL